MGKKVKLALFDMDGTLLNGRSIVAIAERFGFLQHLEEMFFDDSWSPVDRSFAIARFLKGLHPRQLVDVVHDIPLYPEVPEVIRSLKNAGVYVAIVTDSYQFIANDTKLRLSMDDAFANNLIIEDDIITGEFIPHNKERIQTFDEKIYSICKEAVLEDLSRRFNISLDQTIAVGDGMVDRGMLRSAGVGIACHAPKAVQEVADVVSDDLSVVLEYI